MPNMTLWTRLGSAGMALVCTACLGELTQVDTQAGSSGGADTVTADATVATSLSGDAGSTTVSADDTSASLSCCVPHASAGCDLASVEACVCAQSAFCCSFEWDGACAAMAQNRCGGCDVADDTAADTAGPNTDPGTCCTPGRAPGCSNADIQACVCAGDEFCCDVAWDDMCVGAATGLCGAVCGAGPGDCCQPNLGPGCNDPVVEACTCARDPFCCEQAWDDKCVGLSASACGSGCTGEVGSCCTANGTPGCDDATIETCTCNEDPFCCDRQWDDKCIGTATAICGLDCEGGTTTEASTGGSSSSGGSTGTGGSTTGTTSTAGGSSGSSGTASSTAG